MRFIRFLHVNAYVGVAAHLCSTNVTSSSLSSDVLFSCL